MLAAAAAAALLRWRRGMYRGAVAAGRVADVQLPEEVLHPSAAPAAAAAAATGGGAVDPTWLRMRGRAGGGVRGLTCPRAPQAALNYSR